MGRRIREGKSQVNSCSTVAGSREVEEGVQARETQKTDQLLGIRYVLTKNVNRDVDISVFGWEMENLLELEAGETGHYGSSRSRAVPKESLL